MKIGKMKTPYDALRALVWRWVSKEVCERFRQKKEKKCQSDHLLIFVNFYPAMVKRRVYKIVCCDCALLGSGRD
jgi:hypothetical protein